MSFRTNFQPPWSAVLTSAAISFSNTGDNTVVAGIANQTIRIFKIKFVVSTATNITFKDGSTAKSGVESFAANGSEILDYDGEPWYVTSAGSNFVLNQSGTAQVSGTVYYTQS